jgi:DNA polymerase I-like protein with 3'-5' exonuclease and polymerase domains
MLTFKNGGLMAATAADLPEAARGARELFLDVETMPGDGDPHRWGNRPYAGDRICGFALTWDDEPRSFYVPIRHQSGANVPLEAGLAYLRDVVGSCKNWVNPNVKFDAHFAAVDGALFTGRLTDVQVEAKMIDSDRLMKGGYGLDVLARDICERDIRDKEQAITVYLEQFKRGNKKCKDYSLVPSDRMGEYGCEDVISSRLVHRALVRRRPETIARIWEVENLLTPVLWDMERVGLRVDPTTLEIKQLSIMVELAALEEELHRETGMAVVPSNPGHCYELLVNRYGLPVLAWTDDEENDDSGNPSFDSDAITSYLSHPLVATDPKLTRIIRLIQRYRDQNTLLNFFVKPYLRKHVNGVLRPTYNQIVRTGRLSSKDPNSQQLSLEAKELIIPEEGHAFLSADYSQIEFRIICHYMNDPAAVQAYNENPDTDFHTFVAKMCEIDRDPAKNVNFCMGFGGGKDRVVSMLKGNMQLVGSLGDVAARCVDRGWLDNDFRVFLGEVSRRDPAKYSDLVYASRQLLGANVVDNSHRKTIFDLLCQRRGEEVYARYHSTFPGLKRETKAAYLACKARGFAQTVMRRMRHMPEKAAWRAFNSATQGSAADTIKERTIAIAPRYNAAVRHAGIDIRAQVHDEELFHGPTEVMSDPATAHALVAVLEDTEFRFRVPIRSSAAWSDRTWADTKRNKVKIERGTAACGRFMPDKTKIVA